ncbi:MAG: MBL fold metallo-hydrolase [Porticoccaceae bacterium]|nr:MBL fold metallo-hydrolase [Porticoccaceae bacterium]
MSISATVHRFIYIGLIAITSSVVDATPLFYRGDMDDRITKAENGAIINGDYLKALASGPYGEVNVIRVTDRITTVTGYANANFTFIETDNGLIAVDAGSNIGQARGALAMLREITDKPLIALIYTHHHYTGGAGEYRRLYPEMDVYGHPDVDSHLQTTAGVLGPKQARNVGRILGLYLPHTGPDGVVATPEVQFDDPALNVNRHVQVSHPVEDGETVWIDGLEAIFYHAVGDTRDSLIVHFPSLDLVIHNTGLLPTLAPLSTLRGEYYRDPSDLIVSIDKLRQLRARYMIPSHGFPTMSAEEGYEAATAHRDAYSFIYYQSIRAINRGLSPDEMARTVRLPPHLAQHPLLQPTYVDNEYNVRAQYRGLVGWFDGDGASLHPPENGQIGQVLIEGFGGVANVLDRIRKAQTEHDYNLAATLATYILGVEPDHAGARQLKADALRAMAQATPSMQTRNYMLTQALHLEGKIDWAKPPSAALFRANTVDTILDTPPGTYLELLQVRIDPVKSADLDTGVAVEFTDLGRVWTLYVRRGVVEVVETREPLVKNILSLPRPVWAQVASGDSSVAAVLDSGAASYTGDRAAIEAVFAVFD